jgi:hypothetical protein
VGPLGVADLAAYGTGTALAALARRAARGPRRPGWSVRTELAASLLRAAVLRSKRKGIAWLRGAQAALPVRVPLAREVAFEPSGWAASRGLRAAYRHARAHTLLYLHGGA